MRRSRLGRAGSVALIALAVVALTAGVHEGRRGPGRPLFQPVVPVVAPSTSHALVEEALRLYAARQFPRACRTLAEVAHAAPAGSEERQDAGRCFEGWGWQALQDGQPDDAVRLFQLGLAQSPDSPGLLRGLGLASVHAGRLGEALGPLERATRQEPDADVQLLLAHLHDRRDEPDRAMAFLREILERDPEHPAARSLLQKIERESLAETGFLRDLSPRFVVKSRATAHHEVRRVVASLLEATADRVGDALGWSPPERLLVVLYDRGDFHTVTRVHGWASGIFDGKIRLPLPPGPPDRHLLEPLIAHEYAHAAIHSLTRGRAPRWLHEGLAQVLEGAVAAPALRAPGLTLAGVEALVTDPDPARARAGYDLALWVVQDLVDRQGFPAIRTLLDRLAAGDSLADAMRRVYGVPLAEVETRWRQRLGG